MTQAVLTTAHPVADGKPEPTIWGLTPRQVHDRLWAAFGVQVVRRNEPSNVVDGAELYLLCEPDTLVLFRPARVLDDLYWMGARLVTIRVRDERQQMYRERAITDDDRLVRFERVYRDPGVRTTRIALTPDAALAERWQNAPRSAAPWRWLRSHVAPEKRLVRSEDARRFDASDASQVMACLHEIMRVWSHPDATISRAERSRSGVWADVGADIQSDVRIVGPVWVGAGRTVGSGAHIVGPAVLWDEPSARPVVDRVEVRDVKPKALEEDAVEPVRSRTVPGKRVFDILFALVVLAVTLPLYPVVALAIAIEDGWPVFFAHRRQTIGGREFPCLKFRSMYRSAAQIKEQIRAENQADGPQFFMADDPRVTRVGRFIRRTQIDELPQFVNVLLGHMSVVGPRPSPHDENQFCPAWREARLSVRPGVTGLWQIRRTRREGLDFQEWIKFDLEYVESASWALDLRIIARTFRVVISGLI